MVLKNIFTLVLHFKYTITRRSLWNKILQLNLLLSSNFDPWPNFLLIFLLLDPSPPCPHRFPLYMIEFYLKSVHCLKTNDSM